ncbi:hypothetical protein SUNI508_14044 [Seiridium unicorne]|uniref:Uncharacterized protein n=1 Tax=Seiridium unicorne TaxID=138068 RepID=A0ABR2V8J7_9PEZI
MFRNSELLRSSNQASNQTLESLLKLTNQGSRQQETLKSLAVSGQANSVMIKALSVVATVFLPASLIAVSKKMLCNRLLGISLRNTRQSFLRI